MACKHLRSKVIPGGTWQREERHREKQQNALSKESQRRLRDPGTCRRKRAELAAQLRGECAAPYQHIAEQKKRAGRLMRPLVAEEQPSCEAKISAGRLRFVPRNFLSGEGHHAQGAGLSRKW